MPSSEGYVGLLSFCSFAFSVIAAVLAIDLYALFRTGRSGATWRVLIIASVMFALMHVLRLAEVLDFGGFQLTHLSEIVELMFVITLAYAFYLQKRAFGRLERTGSGHVASQPRPPAAKPDDAANRPESDGPDTARNSAEDSDSEDDAEDEEAAAAEWARLNGQADTPARRRVGHHVGHPGD